MANAEAGAAIVQPETKDGSDAHGGDITGVPPVSPIGILAFVSTDGECSNTHNPGNTYLRVAQKTAAYPCQTEDIEATDSYETSVNVSSDVSRSLKYIDHGPIVPRRASTYTDVCPVVECYMTSITNNDETPICTPTDTQNGDAQLAFENGYNEETDTADTETYGTDNEDIPIHTVVFYDTCQTYSCSTMSEGGVRMSRNIGNKDTYLSLDSDNANTYKYLVDASVIMENTDGCTRTPTHKSVGHISATGQYDTGLTSCVTSQTMDATEIGFSRSMLDQDSDVYTQKDDENPDAKLTTVDEELEQCEAIGWNTRHEGTTREDYGATSHHGLEMECETPEMDHDFEDEGQCFSGPSTSECLLHDHPYGVGALSTSDQHGKELQCHHCGIVSRNSSLHIVHMRTHFTRNNFHCDKCCESRANGTNPGVRKSRERGGRPLCKRCGKVIVNGPPKRTCRRCGIMYTSDSRYSGHTCPRIPDTKRKRAGRKRKKPIAEYTCPECNETFSKRAPFKRHLRIHSRENGYKCDICGKVVGCRQSLRVHKRIHSDRADLACSVCYKTYKGKVNLKNHMKIHKYREKKLSCGECGKMFYRQGSLTRHSLVHSGVKAHQCDKCGARFSLQRGLTRHVLAIHDGVKTFTCEYCRRSFSTKGNLISHTRTHTGERPFVCTTCGKRFAVKQKLIFHSKNHTGDRPFPCTTCGKRFALKQVMISHTAIHSEEKSYRCTECNKTFATKQYLYMHSRIHTAVRSFVCSNCGKVFLSKRSLDIHARRHSGETSYRCTKNN